MKYTLRGVIVVEAKSLDDAAKKIGEAMLLGVDCENYGRFESGTDIEVRSEDGTARWMERPV